MSPLLVFLLIVIYTFLPPILLFFTTKMIYREKRHEGVYAQYLIKFLAVISFIPLLANQHLDLGIIPTSPTSIILCGATILLSLCGIPFALKKKTLHYYSGGVQAAFMEEILYRGILHALLLYLTENIVVTVIITSLLFGLWHLKNYYWSGKNYTLVQFFYTAFIYGPLFSVLRIYTGDLYLAILIHFLNDAFFALAPSKWLRFTSAKGQEGLFLDERLQ